MTKFLGIWELDILLEIGNWELGIKFCFGFSPDMSGSRHSRDDIYRGVISNFRFLSRI